MRRLIPALMIAAFLWWRPLAAADRPRLVVIVVVDQFRADYLSTFASHWRSGFKTLLAEGANFRRAQYPYLHTDTCAGHATVGTGTLPRTHGMVSDTWWDRDTGRQIGCTEDEAAPPVTYGRPTTVGASGRRLMVPTLADRLREQRPGARVVTLSLKARSAIGLAGHAGDVVLWFEDAAMAFTTSRAYASAPVPAVKEFIDRSPYEKELGTIWTLRDPAGTYRNRDAGVGERPPAGWSALFPHELKGVKDADAQFAGQWRRSPQADAYLGRLAISLIDAYGLGQRNTTDFLGIGFSAVDTVGHLFGPDSREVEDVASRLDDTLGALIESLDAKVGRANYVLALSADHGVAAIPSAVNGSGRVAGEDVRDRVEEVLRGRYGVPKTGSHVVSNVEGDLYLAAATQMRLSGDPAAVRSVQAAVAMIPGVQQVLYTPGLSDKSPDPIVRAAAWSSVASRNGDFITLPKRDWLLTGRNSVNAASHGTPYDYDQRVPLILFGGGIRRGSFDGPAAPTDIAPTLAAVIGIDMPKVEGRLLNEALVAATSSTR